MSDGELERLAQACSIQLSYRDLEENDVFARPESLLAALKGMGVIEAAADVPGALRRQAEAHWCWSMEPVTVAWTDALAGGQTIQRPRGSAVSLRVPETALSGAANLRVELEGGGIVERSVRLGRTTVRAEATAGGVRHVEVRVGLPAGLPLGYHKLEVEVAGRQLRSLVICAPRKAYTVKHGPAWGVFLPLYALHSKRSWGIGDYTDLRKLIEWAGSKGASVVATLPLLPTFVDEVAGLRSDRARDMPFDGAQDMPFEPSPYQPVSRLFWNEVFVDPEAPIEGDAALQVHETLAAQARALLATREVDYAGVMALKRKALSAQASLLSPESTGGRSLAAYLERRPEVGDYAAFRASMETIGPDWRAWPQRQRQGELSEDDYAAETARFYEFAQWRAHCQMKDAATTAESLGMRSYLDLPVGVHPLGYDAWRFRPVLAQGLTVGAPPDLLATNGQNWGFQPLNPMALRQSGYDYLVQFLRHYFDSAKMLRIDHAIGLHRLYWIPEGGTGHDGVFVRQPSDELYAVLCLESVRNRAVVIAEDLGLVPPEVSRGLKRHGISGMYVQMFEMTGRSKQPLKAPRRQSVASFGTHDLPPFAAYWQDDDLKKREELGLLTPERVSEEEAGRRKERKALVGHLEQRGLVTDGHDLAQVFRGATALAAEGASEWVMLNLEEAWGEVRMQNLPGTTSVQHANWVQRAGYALEDFESVKELTEALETVRTCRPSITEATTEGV